MRILFTVDPEIPVPPPFYGGIERIVAGLITEFRLRGHIIGLMAHPRSTEQVNTFCAWPGTSSISRIDTLQNGLALQKLVRSFHPDIIHSFSRLAYLLPLLFSKVPKVMSYQRPPSLRTTTWGRCISRGSLLFTGCSEYIAASGRKGGGVWHTIPNFINPKKWTFIRKVSDNAPLIFLSRIELIKGCHTAIAIAKASKRRLLIAGNRRWTRSSVCYWEKEIAPHLKKDLIEYVGEVNDEQKNNLLGSAAALLVPIEWEEPFGIVFAEALACGTPVITCPRGALPEIVEDGIHGFHIRSIQEGVEAVAKLPSICRKTCRERVEQRFAVDIIASQYLELYRSGLNRGHYSYKNLYERRKLI